MSLLDKLHEISRKIPDQLQYIQTEEATKTSLVLPFIAALGYDIFNASEFSPEHISDFGTKKGSKVDYSIIKDGKPIILIECKWCGTDLNEKDHLNQLQEYFYNKVVAKFGILTNGIIYRFYSDLDNINRMDTDYFLEIDMMNLKDVSVRELEKFTKSSFEPVSLRKKAGELKYMANIKCIIEDEMINPSEEFIKFFDSKINDGSYLPPNTKERASLISNTFKQLIKDNIDDILNDAIKGREPQPPKIPPLTPDPEPPATPIIATEEEIYGYNLVKSILGEIIDPDRVYIKDRLNFCGINLDNNQQKPITKLYFNEPQKFIGLFDKKKNEKKVKINSVEDINKYADKLKAVVEAYDANKEEEETPEITKILFSFNGKDYEARYWKDVFLQICNIMATTHKDRFDDILQLSGTKNPRFSKNQNDLRRPKLIEGTDIFAEVGFGAEFLTALSRKVIKLFGYPEDSLIIKQSA